MDFFSFDLPSQKPESPEVPIPKEKFSIPYPDSIAKQWRRLELISPEELYQEKLSLRSMQRKHDEVLDEYIKMVDEMYVRRCGYCILNDECLNLIAKYTPIIEMGAGLGFIASLLAKKGVDINCYDIITPDKNDYFPKRSKMHYPVIQAEENIVKNFPDRTLLLIWPPYDEPMAFDILSQYTGDTFIYIGEDRDGCNGDDNFFKLLEEKWQSVKYRWVARHNMVHDGLNIYKRKN